MRDNGDTQEGGSKDEAELKSRLDAFGDLPDPRSEQNQAPPFMSIPLIALGAVISGADNWVDGKAKQSWLETILELPHGILSHDTFGRVFRFMNPQAFQERFLKWVERWWGSGLSGVVALDGKQVRGATEVPSEKAGLYMVSAWAAAQGIVLGQRKVADKSNEITALPALLDVLDIAGCVVTIDARGGKPRLQSKSCSKKRSIGWR